MLTPTRQKPRTLLALPLTADVKLGHARRLALAHYRAVMAAAGTAAGGNTARAAADADAN